jgi:hypothetical protein
MKIRQKRAQFLAQMAPDASKNFFLIMNSCRIKLFLPAAVRFNVVVPILVLPALGGRLRGLGLAPTLGPPVRLGPPLPSTTSTHCRHR